MKEYWFSCPGFTCWIRLDRKRISDSAMIVRKFRGQSIFNLISWAEREFGPVEMIELCGEVR